MLRALLAACLLCGCTGATAVGATTVTAVALGTSALQRSAGGCYAVCTNGTTCNPRTGLCERLPCDGLCSRDEHCETSYNASYCAPGAPAGDISSQAPGNKTRVPVIQQAPPASSGGPPQVTPAAELNPPSSAR